MPDAVEQPAAAGTDTAPPGARADWRLGGPTVSRWDTGIVARALIWLGVALALGALVKALWLWPFATASAAAIVLIGMLIPVVVALRAPRPAGLLRVRALDLLYGVALGLMLRLVQGWLEVAAGGSGALPSLPRSQLRLTWQLDVVLTGVAAPAVAEFFFRGVLLVALYSLLRRRIGATPAGTVAVVATTALFVLVNAFGDPARLDALVTAGLLGLICGTLVMATGRIWGAVLVHVVYGASFVALATAGMLLG